MALTYKKTGVDISGIKSSHKGIGRIISSTHDKSVKHGFGHYAGIVRAQGRDIAVHTDGVGTKVLIAVSPPTIGVPLIFAPFASPLAICKNIFESLRFAAM